MELRYTGRAENDLKKFSREIRERIMQKMQFFISVPEPLKFAKRLTDDLEGDFAFRVNDWRIKFTVSKNTIIVHRVKHRPTAY